MKLTVKDLMIGDWVNYRPGYIDEETNEVIFECNTGFPIRLTCLYDGLSQYDDVLPDGSINTIEVADFELSGISLSPEILEKNGFRKLVIFSTEKWIYGDVRMNNYNYSNGCWRFCADTKRNENSVVYIRFVHELQHALRLCGIEKEIIV